MAAQFIRRIVLPNLMRLGYETMPEDETGSRSVCSMCGLRVRVRWPSRLSVTPGPSDASTGAEARSIVEGVSRAFLAGRIRPERRDLAFRQRGEQQCASIRFAGKVSSHSAHIAIMG
jgi:hypothetical protein